MAVGEPFGFGPALEVPLARIADDVDAELVEDSLDWIDSEQQLVHTDQGRALPFDAALVAVGARTLPAGEHVTTFNDADTSGSVGELLEGIVQGRCKSVAFLAPQPPVWPLPLYEVALMTAARAKEAGVHDLELSLVTAESRPLAAFGSQVSRAVSAALDSAGIGVHMLSVAHARPGGLELAPSGPDLHVERVLAMPHIAGPIVSGLSAGAHGFVPIDRYCCVPRTRGRVFGAGDAVDFPVKHGGVGTQMADTAAAAIAQLAGFNIPAEPFNPILRGKLLTGAEPLYIQARVVGRHGFDSELFRSPPWSAADKVIADELGPYLSNIRLAA
jgi:sulfide:quinone oxidoreductase